MLEETLYQAIQKQDEKAYEYLIENYSKLLWVVVSGVLKGTGSYEDIEDCIADCFLSLWESPEKYNKDRGTIKTYLCILARSRAIDRLRKMKKILFLPFEDSLIDASLDLENDFIQKEKISQVLDLTDQLKAIDKRIFILRYFHEIKPKEIANIVGLGVKEVSNKLYYLKTFLRNKMEVLTDESI